MDICEGDSNENKMSNTSKIKIKNFNGQNFEFWKVKMEDLLVDQEQWVVVELGAKPTSMLDEDWMKIDMESQSTSKLCLVDSILLNVLEEDTMKKLWDNLGNFYQSKSMVNKLFLQKKLYLPRMNGDDSVTKHMHAFNIVIRKLLSWLLRSLRRKSALVLCVHCQTLGVIFFVAIGSNNTTLEIDNVVV